MHITTRYNNAYQSLCASNNQRAEQENGPQLLYATGNFKTNFLAQWCGHCAQAYGDVTTKEYHA